MRWIDSGHMLKDDMLKIWSDDEGPQVFYDQCGKQRLEEGSRWGLKVAIFYFWSIGVPHY
jgi:hypothetical protein